MNDREIARLLRQAKDVRSADAGSVHEAGQELLEAILSSTAPATAQPSPADELVPVRAAPDRRRLHWLVGAAAAVALAIALPMTLFQGGGSIVPAADLPTEKLTGSGNPFLLPTDDSWQLTSLVAYDSTSGEETFTQTPETELLVFWEDADQYSDMYADRQAGTENLGKISVFGQQATLFGYGNERYELLLPPRKGTYIGFRGFAMDSRTAFLNSVAGLRQLDRQDWLEAMPASVVTPERRPTVVQDLLSDVPLPPKFDTARLEDLPTQSRYYFAVRVMSAVTCSWLDDYSQARDEGDETGMSTVAEALSGSRDWKALKQIDAEGDWSQTVHTYAAEVAAGRSVQGYRSPTYLNCGD